MQAENIEKTVAELKQEGTDGKVPERSVQRAKELLTPAQKERMDRLLKDPDALRELLSSPAARALMEQLGGKT